MKIVLPKIIFAVLACALAGCGQSAQEKLAQQQLEQVEIQKKLVAGFEAEAKKAQEEQKAHPLGQEKNVYKKFDLYPKGNIAKDASTTTPSK